MEPEDGANIMSELAKALRSLSRWAVAGGFDGWMNQDSRHPRPAAVVKLAHLRKKAFTFELAKRREPGTEKPGASTTRALHAVDLGNNLVEV